MGEWFDKAKEDARDIIIDSMEELVDCVVDNDGVVLKRDFENCVEWYGKIHEWVDTEFSSREAIDIMEELDRFKETDYGLWQGLDPLDAVKAMGFWTYRNAVQYFVIEGLKELADLDFESLRNEPDEEDEDEDDDVEEFNRKAIEKMIEAEL